MQTQGPSRRALFRGQFLTKPVAVIGGAKCTNAPPVPPLPPLPPEYTNPTLVVDLQFEYQR